MNNLPNVIKIAIVLAIVLMVAVFIFLLFIIVLYSRKQVLFQKEKELSNMAHEKQLLQKEINFQKKAQDEQNRISHDLHDDVGSGITALKLQTEFLKRRNTDRSIAGNIDELLQTCDELQVSIRQILWNLKVGDDNVENFTQRIIHYANSFFGKTNIKVHIVKNKMSLDQFSADTRRNMFLCVKEALNNVYKHSNCLNLELHFSQDDQMFTIEIKDDGVGMRPDAPFGNGLENMKARMASRNGIFLIKPSPSGFHLQLSLNLEEEYFMRS